LTRQRLENLPWRVATPRPWLAGVQYRHFWIPFSFVLIQADKMTTLCKNCVSGYVLPGEPKGTIKDGAYVYSNEPDGQHQDGTPNLTEKTAIILLTDIFGLDLKNLKILADSIGERLHCDAMYSSPIYSMVRTRLIAFDGTKRSIKFHWYLLSNFFRTSSPP
jgi:hypothetical protein